MYSLIVYALGVAGLYVETPIAAHLKIVLVVSTNRILVYVALVRVDRFYSP